MQSQPTDQEAPPPSHDRPPLHAHFARGALESAAHILGSTSASVFAAGLVVPFIAAIDAPKSMDSRTAVAISALAVAFSMGAGLGAMVLRGLAHCAPHTRPLPRAPADQGDGQ